TKYFSKNIGLTDSWETYNYRFTMENVTDFNTKFGFSFGGDGTGNIPSIEHDIYLDNVVLTKFEESEAPDKEDPEVPEIEDPEREDPETENTETEDTEIEDPETEEPNTEEESNDQLPKTGVSTTNFIGIGIGIILVGIVIIFFNKKIIRMKNK